VVDIGGIVDHHSIKNFPHQNNQKKKDEYKQ
jgi:hypothetical protein